MFLNDYGETAWDLKFRIMGFPVRVHPLFWLLAFLLSGGGSSGDFSRILLGMAVVFVSILVHELGHAIAMNYYRRPAHIVLTAFGGYAAEDVGSFSSMRRGSRTNSEQIVISLAGPVAGFALALFAALILVMGKAQFIFVLAFPSPMVFALTQGTVLDNPLVSLTLQLLLMINITWNVINLYPVFPLDGGQIARALMTQRDPWDGISKSLMLGVVVGAVVAVAAIYQRNIWLGILFGSLAFSNWEAYQQMGRGRRW